MCRTVSFQERVTRIIERAKAHGIEIVPGEEFLDTLEKLLGRLDLYRDKPESKGKILVE